MDDIKATVDDAEVVIDIEAAIDRLAVLSPVEYDRVRKAEAKSLGVRETTLNNEVERRRKTTGAGQRNEKSGRTIKLREIEPWHMEVDGAELLSELSVRLSEYIIMPQTAADAATLWVIHTHAIDACHYTPRLFITSPDKRCGKTQLLKILGKAVARPLSAGNISSASFFRTVEATHATLLVDEFDARGKDDEEMRGVVNNGYERDNPVIRCAPNTLEPESFDTFSPCAIASIGKTWPTVEDRSIIIRLHRKRPAEKVRKLRRNNAPELDRLASMAARWAMDNIDDIEKADPATPEALSDRAADIWEPLLSIADLAGGEWPSRARAAALALSADGVIEDESYGSMMLADLRNFLIGQTASAFPTKTVIEHLLTLDERPWPVYGRAKKAINAKQLADILKPYEVRSSPCRISDNVFKGYRRKDIEHAAERYLENSAVTRLQPAENQGILPNSAVTNEASVTGEKGQNPAEMLDCNRVTGETPEFGGAHGNGGDIPPENVIPAPDPFAIPSFLDRRKADRDSDDEVGEWTG